jgi:hypothetical protein
LQVDLGVVGYIVVAIVVLLYFDRPPLPVESHYYTYPHKQPVLSELHRCSWLKIDQNNPHFASFRYEDVRCAQVPKFPYLVHYTINEDTRTIFIAAVYSTYQQPLGNNTQNKNRVSVEGLYLS